MRGREGSGVSSTSAIVSSWKAGCQRSTFSSGISSGGFSEERNRWERGNERVESVGGSFERGGREGGREGEREREREGEWEGEREREGGREREREGGRENGHLVMLSHDLPNVLVEVFSPA